VLRLPLNPPAYRSFLGLLTSPLLMRFCYCGLTRVTGISSAVGRIFPLMSTNVTSEITNRCKKVDMLTTPVMINKWYIDEHI
jgi:hypothetical protein